MIQITVYKGNDKLFSFESTVVPPKGELLWINDTSEYFIIKDAIYKVDTKNKRLKVDIVVK